MKDNTISGLQRENKVQISSCPSKFIRVTRAFERLSTKLSCILRYCLLNYAENINIRKKKNLWKIVKLSPDQEKEIKTYFNKYYGHTYSTKWHRLYQSYTGSYNVKYFPEKLFSTKLEMLINPYSEAEFFGDKNLLPVLFDDIDNVHIPQIYVSCVRGTLRDAQSTLIDWCSVTDYLMNIGECVIKKTTETSSGRDVVMCCIRNGYDERSGESIENLLKSFGDNFNVQERIVQHESLAKLNGSSLNTFRVMTYLLDNMVFCCPVALRLGRFGADKDNIHYGGIGVGIKDDGSLRKYAFSEQGERFDVHPDSKVVFDNYQIPKFHTILDIAKQLHARIPYLGIISWDLSLDEHGQVVLIEMNTIRQGSWFPQMVNGEPLFGENTEQILSIIQNMKVQ